MKNYKIILAVSSLVLAFASCKKDFENPVENKEYTSGDADFSKYVAIGNSLTSGYADGALYASAQKQSFPSILAAAMQHAGGGDFNQPLMPNDIGGFTDLGLSGKLALQSSNGSLTPIASSATSALDNIAASGPYQNLGVPGAKAVHMLFPGYGSASNLSLGLANPYFVRFASSAAASVIGDALSQDPTFFSLWIGNNDILGYATNGGVNETITSNTEFSGYLTAMLDQLTAGGAKGVLANIPNISDIPFFTTVPYQFVPLSDGLVDQLNNSPRLSALFNLINTIDPSRDIAFVKNDPNRMLIIDNGLNDISTSIATALQQAGLSTQEAQAMGAIYGRARMTRADDLILLTAMSQVGTIDTSLTNLGVDPTAAVIGVTAPTDALVLDPSEQAAIASAVSQYNGTISNMASQYDLALYDANNMMSMLTSESGIIYNAVSYTAAFVTGGAFSLDGVHPTPRGYAIIANGFVDAINDKYGSNLPMVNPNNYSGVEFP